MAGRALDLVRRYKTGETTVEETVRDVLDSLVDLRGRIGGVAATDPERSLAEAAASDHRLRSGSARPLEGVPITVKDWIDVAGWPVTGTTGRPQEPPGPASIPGHGRRRPGAGLDPALDPGEGRRRPDAALDPTSTATLDPASTSVLDPGDGRRRPGVDASAVARLRAAGAIVVAISSAMADNALYGETRNPLDPARAPGGSSSGTAVLVAAGAVPLGLGSDSGGSIRLPAAWCGISGLKPTFGRVPLTGHFPRCGALEDGRTVLGPLATTVSDLALVLAVTAGPDGLDAGVPPVPLGDPSAVDVAGLRVGVMAPDEPTMLALEALAGAGATVVAEPVPDVREEALELTRRHWGRAGLSGTENVRVLWDWDRFRRRLLMATAHLDVLLTPATQGPPPLWRESTESDYFSTLPWSLTGAPVVVTPSGPPSGPSSDMVVGWPGAVQVVARPWDDHIALAAARQIELARQALGQ
ncbi:amidase [Nonomuraea zeae]|uniref:Amidase n=1 Tax=Nonomuraea zeae TaxID=1642303 RepID=A0A5S4GPP0_9ACTN|nr:amidase [Nonomuraea zeae]TMR34837.1 amidase [Nonomuraea zeae]